jgi:hypothetical protein
MEVVGIGRLMGVRADPRWEPRVVAWLAELEEATMKDMAEITSRFGSATSTSGSQVEFALGEELVIETLVQFSAQTLMVRAVRFGSAVQP